RQCVDNAIVVIKSTIPPGTISLLQSRIPDDRKSKIHLVHNPEFMREGSALTDIYTSNPIVIGTDSQVAQTAVLSMYRTILQNKAIKTIMTDFETAELIKYA